MKSIFFLQLSNFLSGAANAVVMITIPWLVLEVTDSAAFAGLVVALSSIPSLLIAPFGGVIIHRLGSRFVSATSDFMSTASVVAIPILALTGRLTGFTILIFALIGAVFDPLGYTARKTMIQATAEKANFNVDRLNGIHEGLLGTSWVIGPAIGAWLIAIFGASNSFWIAGGLFILAALAIVFVSKPRRTELSVSAKQENQLSLGFRRIWSDKYLRVLLFSVLILAAIYLPTESVVLPAYFESVARPIDLGLVISVLAGGSTLSAFAYGWIISRISGRNLVRIAFIGAALGTLVMSFLPPLSVMLLAALLLGLSWGPFMPYLTSKIQTRFDPAEHPMIFSAQTAVFYAAPPLGMVIVGFAVEEFGVSTAYLGIGVVITIVAVIAVLSKTLRDN